MELQQLQHFLTLARVGNIGRAADELHITHSGLSRSIKTLEEFLGLRLFLRQSRGVSITPFGEALLPRAGHILNERRRAIRELEALRALHAGHVEVALHPVFDDTIAAAVIGGFADRFPAVAIDLWTGADPELSQRLIGGEFDFAFSCFGAERDPSLVYESLMHLPLVACARAGHPAAGRPFGDDQLVEAECLLLGARSFLRGFDDHFRNQGLAPPHRLVQCPSMAMLRTLLAARDSFAWLPRFIIDRPGSELVAIEGPIYRTTLEAGLIYRRGSFHSVPAHSLLEAFRQGAAAVS